MRKSCIKCQSQRLQWSESFRTTVLWSNCFCQKTMHTTRTLKDVPNRFLALYTESICNGQKMINSWMMFDYHVKSCDVNGSLEPLKLRFCQKSFAILHNAIYINSFPENSLKTFIPLLIKGSSQLSVWCFQRFQLSLRCYKIAYVAWKFQFLYFLLENMYGNFDKDWNMLHSRRNHNYLFQKWFQITADAHPGVSRVSKD